MAELLSVMVQTRRPGKYSVPGLKWVFALSVVTRKWAPSFSGKAGENYARSTGGGSTNNATFLTERNLEELHGLHSGRQADMIIGYGI